jgi:hypothetical protein
MDILLKRYKAVGAFQQNFHSSCPVHFFTSSTLHLLLFLDFHLFSFHITFHLALHFLFCSNMRVSILLTMASLVTSGQAFRMSHQTGLKLKEFLPAAGNPKRDMQRRDCPYQEECIEIPGVNWGGLPKFPGFTFCTDKCEVCYDTDSSCRYCNDIGTDPAEAEGAFAACLAW